ncbi:MAG TPA: FHA domain-containing protein [Roseiflexaceae bacterium]|nr:FHA domain-containing protein [Roseiflexaceae bacterium]
MTHIATPRFHVISSSSAARTVEFTDLATLGRTEDNDIVLDDASVSGYHAMLLIEDGEVLLLDMESAAGTSVNGMPASPDELVPLVDGDMVKVGRVLLRYEAPFHFD